MSRRVPKRHLDPRTIDPLQYRLAASHVPGLGLIPHLLVWRRDGHDGITWDELQAVKNEALGPETVCIEVYPAASEVVNEIPMRHLWVMPDGWPVPSLRRDA